MIYLSYIIQKLTITVNSIQTVLVSHTYIFICKISQLELTSFKFFKPKSRHIFIKTIVFSWHSYYRLLYAFLPSCHSINNSEDTNNDAHTKIYKIQGWDTSVILSNLSLCDTNVMGFLFQAAQTLVILLNTI